MPQIEQQGMVETGLQNRGRVTTVLRCPKYEDHIGRTRLVDSRLVLDLLRYIEQVR
jgi:hypothetical protein